MIERASKEAELPYANQTLRAEEAEGQGILNEHGTAKYG